MTINGLDVPIAIRKGVRFVRSCTEYPISNYLLYFKLLQNYRTCILKIDSAVVLKNILDALSDSRWKVVVMEEMKTWELVFVEKRN